MKIAIDARFYGNGHTGLGRYTTNVLTHLPKYLKDHTLQVLLRDAEFNKFPPSKNIEKIRCEIPHYSLSEQLKLPSLLNDLKSDLLYTLHFNTPILSKIPTIVTVHDLIKSSFTGRDTTTRSPWMYSLKRFGYNQVISKTLTHAKDIIVPTNTVKNDILATFPQIPPERIFPVAEAPDDIFRHPVKSDVTLPKKYLLFVGNAYPHKNLKVLLDAFTSLNDKSLHLVIVAKRSPFLSKVLAPYDLSRIVVLSDVSDLDLVAVYQKAHVLVTPSLMEGYGLVGLEALMVGTPVIASNIAVYREVYGNKVIYFDPSSVADLIHKIKLVGANPRVRPLIFPRTWDDVAKEIGEVINARSTRL
jgi:glycosyltransferase involved in cell wall biosynthesis